MAITLSILKPSVNNLPVRIFVRAAGSLHDPIQRHKLGHHNLAHAILLLFPLRLRVGRTMSSIAPAPRLTTARGG